MFNDIWGRILALHFGGDVSNMSLEDTVSYFTLLNDVAFRNKALLAIGGLIAMVVIFLGVWIWASTRKADN